MSSLKSLIGGRDAGTTTTCAGGESSGADATVVIWTSGTAIDGVVRFLICGAVVDGGVAVVGGDAINEARDRG